MIIGSPQKQEKVFQINGLNILVAWEPDPRLRRESGWYIVRMWSDRGWRDFSRPGYGVTYWIRPEKAKEFGLLEV